MEFDFSVVVLTYHPDLEKLLSTLRSVLLQRGASYEIILADDGSPNFPEEAVRSLMAEYGFSDYSFCFHEKNGGTVKNLSDAVHMAKGTYVKPISPGDYLYSETTLSDVCAFIRCHGGKALFGDMIFYAWEDEALKTFSARHPIFDELYLPDQRKYSHRKVLKHQTVYSDFLCGASVFVERELFCKGLDTVRDTVIYAEDTVMQWILYSGERVYKIPQPVVWYEYGTGISTNQSERIFTDFRRFYDLLSRIFPDKPYIKRAQRIWRRLKPGKTPNIVRILNPDKVLFGLRRRFVIRKDLRKTADEAFFFRVRSAKAPFDQK